MRKIIIALLVGILSLPAVAQDYAPKKGNFQASLLLGSGMFYYSTDYMLMPQNPASVSLYRPSATLEMNDPNQNFIINMIGAEFKYFVTDQIAVTFIGAGLVNNTPSRDKVESSGTQGKWDYLPEYTHIEAELKTRVSASLGVNYHLKVSNERISPYAGIQGTFQFAQVSATAPFKGQASVEDVDFGVRAGQTIGISPSLVAGVEYSLQPGLIVGFEIKPMSYYYSGVQLFAQPGIKAMNGINQEFAFFTQPRFKIGFRF